MIQIAEDVFQIPLMPRQSLNVYLLGDILVDAGAKGSGAKILRALEGRTVTTHVLTHAHPDHQGATHQICAARNIPLWCHKREKTAAETGHVSLLYPDPRSVMARLQERWLAGPGHPVDRALTAGDKVGDFTVIGTPGHTPGHIALWRKGDRTLIAGDAAFGMNIVTTRPGLHLPLKMATVDMALARDSIAKLAALNPARVAFGHGPVADGAEFNRFAANLA